MKVHHQGAGRANNPAGEGSLAMTDTTQADREAQAREVLARPYNGTERAGSIRLGGNPDIPARDALAAMLAFATPPVAGIDDATEPAVPVGMKAWHGGESAPEDWDGDTGGLIFRIGDRYAEEDDVWFPYLPEDEQWGHEFDPHDIIAYTPTPSDVSKDAGGDETFTGVEAWDELVNVDDRTSPEEYPDMCLITRDELVEFCSRAALSAPPPVERAGIVKWLRERSADSRQASIDCCDDEEASQRWVARMEDYAFCADQIADGVHAYPEPCPVCSGDCSSANPPVLFCPMRDIASTPVSQPIEDRIRADERDRCARTVEALDSYSIDTPSVGFAIPDDIKRAYAAALRQSGADREETA